MNSKNQITKKDLEFPKPGHVVPGGIYANPISDPGFKLLLASVSSLTDFLNAVMHLDKEHEIEKLRFKTRRITYHISDASGDEKKIWSFDIRAKTRDGRNIDVEVQNLCHAFFCDRVLTYGSALVLKGKAELDKARAEEDRKKVENRTPPELTDDEKRERRLQTYELNDTVCVWVCNFAIPKNSTETWDDWMLYSGNELRKGSLLPITDRIKYIFLQLPNFTKNAGELETAEDQWIYVLKHAFESTAEISVTNAAVTEALERLKFTKTSKDSEMITREERDCTIATIEYEAEMRGMKRGEERERQRSAAIIAAKDESLIAKDAEIAKMKAELEALRALTQK